MYLIYRIRMQAHCLVKYMEKSLSGNLITFKYFLIAYAALKQNKQI